MGGGLLLRLRNASASWVLRFTSQTRRRREMGVGAAALGSSAQAGASLTGARKRAQAARTQLEAAIAWGGGALTDAEGIAAPAELLARLTELQQFARSAAAAVGDASRLG